MLDSCFSGGFANQLQVLLDGVSVYTPLFAGVWWHNQDIDMADVRGQENNELVGVGLVALLLAT